MGQKAPSVNLEYTELIKETAKAWLLDIQDKQAWFPKSQCSIDEDQQLIRVPEWLAESKELSIEKLPPVDHKIKEPPRNDIPF